MEIMVAASGMPYAGTGVVIVLLAIAQRDWRGKGPANHATKGLVR